MPGRIRYVPPSPLHDDEFNDKALADEKRSEGMSEKYSQIDVKSPIAMLVDPKEQTHQPQPEQNGKDQEEVSFESLDQVAPLPFPRGYSETFTAENFTYTEVTVNDDEEDDVSQGSSCSSSSEDAFIEVNHDDASVVSTLTLETALMSKKSTKKKKKKKKVSKSKKKKNSALSSQGRIVEEEECSQSGASEQTDKTGKTQNTAQTSRSKKDRLPKATPGEENKSVTNRASAEEVVEVAQQSKRLPALSNLETISTMATSTKTTNAVASTGSDIKFLKAQPDSKRAPEADTVSESAPPIPQKSDRSAELILPDDSTFDCESQSQQQKLVLMVNLTDSSSPKKFADEGSVKSASTMNSAKKSKARPKGKADSTSACPSTSDVKSNSSQVESTIETPPSKNELPTIISQKSNTRATPASVSSLKVSSESLKSPVAKVPLPLQQKPSSVSSLKDPPQKPASTNRLQAPPSQMVRPGEQKTKIVQQTNSIPPSPKKTAPVQKLSIPKGSSPAASSNIPTSSLAKKLSDSKQGMNVAGTVARLPTTSTLSEGLARNSGESPQRRSSAATAPGAYHVQGSKMHLASEHSVNLDDFSVPETIVSSKQGKKNARVAQPPISTKNLVVAAELSDDVEAQIEQEVRRRIMASAVQADLVSVESETSMKLPTSGAIGKPAAAVADLKELHKHQGVNERLFGDSRQMVEIAASPESIRKRDYLQWEVKRDPLTNQWIASVTTNQKAMEEGATIEMEMSKVSFATPTQQEAYETGLSNATPLMQRFDHHPTCHCCKSKFAMFRRPSNCRNCGVCICSSCAATWPSKMLPDTYLNKSEKSNVTVCLACDWLARSFHNALLSGNYSLAVDLWSTGNVNLRNPIWLDKKDEAMYPIHLATIGGNLKLVRWLISERYCPLEMIDPKKRSKNQLFLTPVVTSKGLSALEIALLHQRLDIVHYFFVEQGMSMFHQKNIGTDVALANLTSLLNLLPSNFFQGMQMQMTSVQPTEPRPKSAGSPGNLGRSPSL
ncbi:FYVE zinc finger domain containing protein [Nitzschia inconspicua]|uniref:FYVE zinc finger domain containing protein n=1 Tax=Nitzschia inconspicua TaxID=303405 RepID=A0A9K3KYN9_9STRA|nr:FYVE zinc finger domain containing protein [Nitzschia inconspicua]